MVLSQYLWSAFVSVFNLKDAEKVFCDHLCSSDVFPTITVFLSSGLLKSFVGMGSRGARASFHIYTLSLTSFFPFPRRTFFFYYYWKKFFFPSAYILAGPTEPPCLYRTPRFCEDPITVSTWTAVAVPLASHVRQGHEVRREKTGESSGNLDNDWQTDILPYKAALLSPGCFNHCDKIIHVSF